MSRNVDERIVDMKFNNSQFEKNIQTSIKSLDNLKKGLKLDDAAKDLSNLDKAGKNFSLAGIASAVENIQNKFSTLGIVGITALQNITNAAISAGSRIASALTIDPMKMGFAEYETQINAVQTILANTQNEGATLQDVNKALDELNLYADKTIYNFTEMTRNIGTFTAAGVKLDTSVAAIKGIANLAALSGSNAQQASTAMYQLSQALAAGKVNLMDWNSVVNAGMGGKVFQDALIETARVHGVAIDDMIAKEGSFRNTLQNGWLTSEVLTETLQKFTGDLTEEQLRQMGYTEEQIAGIVKMGQTANDAATKVKTFSQLFDTLGEAMQSGWTQSWEIVVGDFEEAKSLFTNVSNTLSGFINNSANARNELLQGWKDLGGRESLIEALSNAFNGLISIAKPIGEAFRSIFPRTTSEQLFNLTEGFRKFTERLILSEDTAEKVKNVFQGLFSGLKIGINTVKSAVSIFANLLGNLSPLAGVILDVASGIGNYVTKANESIESTNIFAKGVSKVKDVIDSLFKKIGPLSDIFGSIGSILSKIGSVAAKVASSGLEKIFDLLSNFDISNLYAIVGSGVLFNLSGGFKGLVDSLTSVGDSINSFFGSGSGTFGKISEILGSVKDSLETWQKDIQAGTLLKIAAAIGILAVSLTVLSSIDQEKLVSALIAISALFLELFASMSTFQKSLSGIKGVSSGVTALIGISASILILSGALKSIANLNWDQLAVGLTGVGASMAALTTVAVILSKQSGKIVSGTASLLSLSASVLVLAEAVEKFGSMDTNSVVQGLASVAAVLAGLTAFAKFNSGSKGMISIGVGLVAVSSAMVIMSKAISSIGSLDMSSIEKGLLGMGGALLEVSIAVNTLPKGMAAKAVGLVGVASSLLILASALQTFGSMSLEEIGKGLLTMGVALLEISVAMIAMKGAAAGAVALSAVSASLILLSTALGMLGSMSVTEIVTALVTLAGTFTVLGVAGLLLAPVTPVIAALSAALLIFGAACITIGAGVLALSVGLSGLTVSAIAAAGALISTIATTIPLIAEQIGLGIIAFAQTIGNGSAAILQAVATILVAISNAIIQAAPSVAEAIVVLIQTVLTTLANHAPDIVQAGFDLIVALLNGIANNIGGVVESAVNVISNFMRAVSEQGPKLVDAGFKMITDFINGLANTIRARTPELVGAMGNLAGAMIQGLIGGIGSAASRVVNSLVNVARNAINGVKNFLGIHSPSRVFRDQVGKNIMLGWSRGNDQYSSQVVSSMERVGKAVVGTVSGISKDVQKNAPDLSGIIAGTLDDKGFDDSPVITPVIDVSKVQNGVGTINSMLSGASSYGISSRVSTMEANAVMAKDSKGFGISRGNGNDNSDIIEALADLQEEMYVLNENVTNMQIVLDTGVLVGQITPGVDKSLGKKSSNKGRGI